MDNTELIKQQTRCVSHEIRNHVSICEMYTEIIKKHLEKDGYKNESVENAIECIKKSLKIIGTSLLDLKSFNNLTMQNCDFKTIAEEGVQLAKAYIQGKNIKINSLIKNTATIYADDNKLLACIVNIIKNGIEAIEIKGEINVIGEVKDNFASLKISNNGKAISKEKQKIIFDEGFTTKPTGNGLGLHICKHNLEAQNAILRLNKSTGKVTEFEILIPVLV